MVNIDTVIATMKLELTHCARSWPMPNCKLMSGMPTFMMVDEMMAAIEPIMIVLMGGMVGSMLVAMYLPMFKMSSVVG